MPHVLRLAVEQIVSYKNPSPNWVQTLRVRGRLPQSMNEDRQIVAALESGNPELAASTLREHVAIQGEKFHDLMASYNPKLITKTG